MRFATALLLVGCSPASPEVIPPPAPTTQPAPTTPAPVPGTPSVALAAPPALGSPPAGDVVPLAKVLTVATTEPTALTLHLDDGERVMHVAFPEVRADHVVPVLGSPADGEVTLTLTLQAADGASLEVDAGTWQTPPYPDPFPTIEVLARDSERMEPGYTFAAIKSPSSSIDYLVALDDRLRLVWWWDDAGSFGDVRVRPDDAVIFGIRSDEPTAMTFLGEITQRFAHSPVDPVDVPLPTGTSHHEAFPLPDGGLWTLCYGSTTVVGYPSDYDDPTGTDGVAWAVADQCIVRLDDQGNIVQQVWMSEVLDTHRIGFDSLQFTAAGWDWVHLNGVVPTDDGGVLVSARHQDAVVKLDADGQLVWILGDHTGWAPEFVPYLLTPIGELSWPYHQHAPAVGPDGVVWMFDNHSYGRTPYTPEEQAEPELSRVVGYRVDPVAMTVEQVASLAHSPVGPLYSPALGDADPLPLTGHVLGDYGFIDGEGEDLNEALGRGRKAVHLVEYDLDAPDDPALALRLSSDVEALPEGWKMYRVERIPSLYPPQVEVWTTPSAR